MCDEKVRGVLGNFQFMHLSDGCDLPEHFVWYLDLELHSDHLPVWM